MSSLIDSHGREFVYLRLSVTDRCNFRCVYCLPDGYTAAGGAVDPELSVSEIRRLVTAFANLGLTKVRLTGGEPTVRRDIVEIAHAVAAVPGIQRVAMTTNGNRLAELARPLRLAGVSAVNVSVDSLDRETFARVTGTDRLEQVLAGIDESARAGFETIKINSVLLRDVDHDLERFMEWIRTRPISVRFIELMRTGRNGDYFEKQHQSGGLVQLALLRSGWNQVPRRIGDGPAVVYTHPDYLGSIGIIAPYSSDFCSSCNRLRVSSRGALRLCLFGERDASLREYLQDDHSQEALGERVRSLVLGKPISHQLHEGKYGNTWNLAGIGG